MTQKLSETDKRSFAEKIMEWGNWVFGVMVLGQIVTLSQTGASWILVIGGILFWVVAYWIAYLILKRR